MNEWLFVTFFFIKALRFLEMCIQKIQIREISTFFFYGSSIFVCKIFVSVDYLIFKKIIFARHIFRRHLLCLYILNATPPRTVESPYTPPRRRRKRSHYIFY
jgi:hypothetical protein